MKYVYKKIIRYCRNVNSGNNLYEQYVCQFMGYNELNCFIID